MTPDMADAHATARARDARVEESFEERAERYGLDWDVVAHLMSEQPTRRAYRTRTQAIDPETGTFTPLTQEPDMTKHDRHDELVALLRRIADTLDGFRGAPDLPTAMATNLEAIKHEAETPMRGHGECCEPAPAEAEDERISAWHRVADHPFFRGCYAEERPLIDAMLDRLTLAATAAGTVHNHGPAQGRDCSERTDGHVHIRGMCMASAPADDLPGEPVEPGDLRAGDRVAFTWWGRERITCTLVSSYDDTTLRSDAPDSDGYYPSIVYRAEWRGGISAVRLIERAPREDENPDEALARVIFGDAYGSHEGLRLAQLDVARAAREHIAATGGAPTATRLAAEAAQRNYDAAQEQRARAEQAEAERDEWRERLLRLRADLSPGGLIWPVDAALRRDDERAAKGGSDA